MCNAIAVLWSRYIGFKKDAIYTPQYKQNQKTMQIITEITNLFRNLVY